MQRERNNTDLSQLIKAKDVAYIFNISLSNVYKLVREKRIPYKRIGSSVRFRYDEVLDAIETHSIEMRTYVTRKELAAQLGVHYQTVTTWTEQGFFDEYMHKIGGIVRYNLTAIILAFEKGKFENNVSHRILSNIKQKVTNIKQKVMTSPPSNDVGPVGPDGPDIKNKDKEESYE